MRSRARWDSSTWRRRKARSIKVSRRDAAAAAADLERALFEAAIQETHGRAEDHRTCQRLEAATSPRGDVTHWLLASPQLYEKRRKERPDPRADVVNLFAGGEDMEEDFVKAEDDPNVETLQERYNSTAGRTRRRAVFSIGADQAALLQQMLDEEIMLTADNGVRVGNAFARRDGSPSRQLVALRGEGGSWCVRCDVCNIANILAVGKLRDPSADLRDIASQAKRHVGAWKSLLNHRPVREHWRQLALITGLALPVPAAPEPKPRSMKRDLRGTLPPRDDAPHGPETRVPLSNRRRFG